MTTQPTLADLWATSADAERLTPPEQWTHSAKAVVLMRWHGEHRGYLSHEEADRVLAEAYLHPMPTITIAEICAATWERSQEKHQQQIAIVEQTTQQPALPPSH